MIKFEELMGKIKSRGYWRIHFEPTEYIGSIDSPIDCLNLISKNGIDLQGWDFPHFPISNDDHQIKGTGDKFCEALTDFGHHKEFWRFYTSGQFISYIAFAEDWYSEHFWEWKRQQYSNILPNTKLGVYFNVIMLSCQIFEFLSKLAYNKLYLTGLNVKIKLFNTQDRELWGQNKSWETDHFSYKTRSNTIETFNRFIKYEDIIGNAQENSIICIKNILNSFNWNPADDQIKMYVENMLKGK